MIANIDSAHANIVEARWTYNATDSLFATPYVDVDEWREKPIRHRYIHGGFKDTDTRFSLYFPSKKDFENRFFQYITPVPDSENLSQGASGEEDKIRFSIKNGAYFIETNGDDLICQIGNYRFTHPTPLI